jgi:hypothetical protein
MTAGPREQAASFGPSLLGDNVTSRTVAEWDLPRVGSCNI